MQMFLSYNGPDLGESDGLLCEDLTRHFNPKGWHFVKQNHLFQTEGKPLGKILKEKVVYPSMNKSIKYVQLTMCLIPNHFLLVSYLKDSLS